MRLKSELYQRQSEIIGQAPSIRRAIELALNVADTTTTVMIQGESGTGKELLANLIHFNSAREDKPYIKINCGAIPETLLESELFGHEKGSFTDARAQRRGRFEEADGGTLSTRSGDVDAGGQGMLRVCRLDFTRSAGRVDQVRRPVIAREQLDPREGVDDATFRKFSTPLVFFDHLPPLRERSRTSRPCFISLNAIRKERRSFRNIKEASGAVNYSGRE